MFEACWDGRLHVCVCGGGGGVKLHAGMPVIMITTIDLKLIFQRVTVDTNLV